MRTLTERLSYIQESVGADKIYTMLEDDKITVQVVWIAGNSVIPFAETYDSSALKSSLECMLPHHFICPILNLDLEVGSPIVFPYVKVRQR